MANLPIALVEISGISKLEDLHNLRQRSFFGLQKEVIFHQSVGIEMKGMFLLVFREIRKVGSKIFFVQEYSLSLVSPSNYMVKGGRKMNSRFARHTV